MKKTIMAIMLSTALVGCASYDDVRPGADGIHYVTVGARDQQEAAREAISQARNFCKSRAGAVVILNEEHFYEGKMTQDVYETHKTLSEIATAAGSAIWVLSGNSKTEDAGAVVATAGGIYNASLDDPYMTKLTFQCQ